MTIVKVNGVNVDVVQTGSGRDLVLLHSLLTDRSAFDLVVPALAKTRRLTLVNLPGYGASSPTGAAIEDYADHIAALFTALRLTRQTDVLGNGFGGFISIALAARHGGRFDRLIVADALAAFPEPAKVPLRALADRISQEGMAGALDIAIRRMFPEAFIAANPDLVAERKRALEQGIRCASARRASCSRSWTLGRSSPRSAFPVLVMAGALDQTTPPYLRASWRRGFPVRSSW